MFIYSLTCIKKEKYVWLQAKESPSQWSLVIHVVVLYLICYKQYHFERLMQIQTKLNKIFFKSGVWDLIEPPSQKSGYQLMF